VGERGGIERVGLGQLARGLGEIPDLAWVTTATGSPEPARALTTARS
jgi:hypothetical protein